MEQWIIMVDDILKWKKKQTVTSSAASYYVAGRITDVLELSHIKD